MIYKRRSLSADSPCAMLAAALLLLAAGALGVNFAWNIYGLAFGEGLVEYFLPIAGCVAMAVLLLSRKTDLMPTVVPTVLGIAFLAMRSVSVRAGLWGLTVVLYIAFAAIYVLTVSGVLDSRKWLLLICGLPFLFRIFVEDIFISEFDGFVGFLPELAVLLILAAQFLVAWGMRRGRLQYR